MGLFKNNVGRPSNETIARRRKIYIIIVFILVALVGAGVFYTMDYFKKDNKEVSGGGKNASVSVNSGKASGDVTSTINCAKHDGVIDLADIESMWKVYKSESVANFNRKTADIDGDGDFDVYDVQIAENTFLYKIGDVNDDGKITSADSRLIMRYATGLEKPNILANGRADIDSDTKITSADSRLALRISSGSGDVCNGYSKTGDNKLTNEDLDMMLQFYSGITTPSSSQKKAADMNNDGLINQNDITLAYKKLYPNARYSCSVVSTKSDHMSSIVKCTFKNMKGLYAAIKPYNYTSLSDEIKIPSNNYTNQFTVTAYSPYNKLYVRILPSYISSVYFSYINEGKKDNGEYRRFVLSYTDLNIK